jgi:hypothetical protein
MPLQSQSWQTPPAATGHASSIVYVNREYGFRFYLPQSWKGYSATVKRTEGDFAKVNPAFITIRNPHWSRQEPYEDIPIMVFAGDAWPKVADGSMSVSAAPFPPQELGRNKKYVFALPPRYNYDFSTGYEEVDKIMKSKPLRGFD